MTPDQYIKNANVAKLASENLMYIPENLNEKYTISPEIKNTLTSLNIPESDWLQVVEIDRVDGNTAARANLINTKVALNLQSAQDNLRVSWTHSEEKKQELTKIQQQAVALREAIAKENEKIADQQKIADDQQSKKGTTTPKSPSPKGAILLVPSQYLVSSRPKINLKRHRIRYRYIYIDSNGNVSCNVNAMKAANTDAKRAYLANSMVVEFIACRSKDDRSPIQIRCKDPKLAKALHQQLIAHNCILAPSQQALKEQQQRLLALEKQKNHLLQNATDSPGQTVQNSFRPM